MTDVNVSSGLLATGDTIYYGDNYSANPGMHKVKLDGTNYNFIKYAWTA